MIEEDNIREESICCDFLENDRIWPPFLGANRGHPFVKALVEVLRRLPDEAYDTVSDIACFVVEDPRITACNVPFNRNYPPASNGINVRFDTIVIFHAALVYSHNALIGLLAHELAHSLISGPDFITDEKSADSLAIQWGFSKELEFFKAERQKKRTCNMEY